MEYVVVNSAGCGSTMKEYADLLADDPTYADRAKGFSRAASATSPRSSTSSDRWRPRHPLELSVAYHDACHLGHAQGVREPAATAAARRIPGLELQ